MQEARAAFERGDYARAQVLFEALFEAHLNQCLNAAEGRSLSPEAMDTRVHLHQYLCLIHKARLDYPAALLHAQQAVKYAPSRFSAWGNLANLQRDLQDFPQAQASYAQALRYCDSEKGRAQLRFNQALAQLAAGDYTRGARGFLAKAEGGNERPGPAVLQRIPRWQGESLVGKRVLIQALEGFGDCLQWLRFLPSFQMHTRCERVGFCPHPELSGLLLSKANEVKGYASHPAFTLFKDATTAIEQESFDVWLPLYAILSLCHAQVHALPSPWQQLFPAPVADLYAMSQNARKPTTPLHIAVAWRANPLAPTAQRRNCPFEVLQDFMCAYLVEHPEVTFYSFQYAPDTATQSEINVAAQSLPLVDLGAQLQTFEQTAGYLRQMDALITVDTVMAHLGGALGITTHLLLSYVADWRWLTRERDHSPWYPDTHGTFRLYRQRKPGDWGEVLQRVSQAISG